MSEQQEQRDYEALNADTALRLNKAQQRITALEAERDGLREYYMMHKSYCIGADVLYDCNCGLDELLSKQEPE